MTKTQLRVLPVLKGDAFLLSCARGKYLMDGGADISGVIPQMLAARSVRSLRAAICTSSAGHRFNGILGLLEQKHPVTELWLPSSVGRLCSAAFHHTPHSRSRISGPQDDSPAAPPCQGSTLFHGGPTLALWAARSTACPGSDPVLRLPSEPGDPTEALSHFLSLFHRDALWDTVHKIFPLKTEPPDTPPEDTLAHMLCKTVLDRALHLEGGKGPSPRRLASTLARVGLLCLFMNTYTAVRFFERTNRLANQLVARHPFRCLNCMEMDPEIVFQVGANSPHRHIADTVAQQYDPLVFQYGERQCSVLFCSDSSFRFMGISRYTLDRPTVITAPHHGSCSHDRVYSVLFSSDPTRDVWVRGTLPGRGKVSEYFSRMDTPLSLESRKAQLHEIVVEFDPLTGSWQQLSSCGRP